MVSDKARQQLIDIRDQIDERLEVLKTEAGQDLEIDELNLDTALVDTPKRHSKWLAVFTDETITLKNLYSFKEKTKLERWKYWMGKQTDKYYAENGLQHEKILKSDVDKYMAADDKLELVNDVVTRQKALVDYVEKVMKEIGNRGFHIKSIIEWRRFTSGS
jgi:hypothetical protein